MSKITIQLKTTSDANVSGLNLVSGDVRQFRVYVDGTTTELLVSACRADFRELALPAEDSATSLALGQEILDKGMISASLDNITWQDISGFDNAIDLGVILTGAYKDLYIKLTVPSNAETGAVVGFGLAFRAR